MPGPARVSFAAILVAGAALAAPAPERPVDTGETEKVVVRLVTLDVTVLDAKDRAVPGLGKDDFALEVDGKPMEIATLDADCSAAPADAGSPGAVLAAESPADSRRIVLALDYLHLRWEPKHLAVCADHPERCMLHASVLDNLERAIRLRPALDEEIMLVALTGSIRVEQPFTRDRDVLLESIARMRKDTTLYAGKFGHSSEEPLFRSLEALTSILGSVAGQKAVTLFTAGPGPSDERYESDFRRLAALASDARVSIYTVDSVGLQHISGFG